MIWSYLRSRVRESILAGVNDALVEIEGNGTNGHDNGATDPAGALALLRAKLTPALPAPTPADVPIPASTRPAGASGDEGVSDGTPAPPAGRNGKRRATATA